MELVATSELGLEETDVEELCMRLFDEVALLGGHAEDVRSDIDPHCPKSDSCLRERGNKIFLSMSATRIGPILEVELRLLPPEGEALTHKQSFASIKDATMLSPEMRTLLRPVRIRAIEPDEKHTDSSDEKKRIHIEEPPPPAPVKSFPVVGVGLASVGALAAAGFGALAGLDAAVLSDANSSGANKNAAAKSGPLYLAGAAVGTIVLLAGAVVLFLE